MNKKVKKIYIIKIIQFLIYGISIIGTFLYRKSSPDWPFYLLIIGILIGNFIPFEYRSNFFSMNQGVFLKNHTRRLETIIEIVITCITIFIVMLLNVFFPI